MSKPFKTIDDQYNLLLSRGLSFTDKEKAKRYLIDNNYYNVINCYAKFFIDCNDQYVSQTNFDEITSVHYFDKELKSVLFKYIIEAEKHFKSIIAYYFSEAHSDQDYSYLIATNFKTNNILKVTTLISSLSNIIKKYQNANDNNSIKHYINHHNNVPFWVLSNYMTFGQIVAFFKYMLPSEQNKVAKEFSYFLNENLGTSKSKLQVKELISFLDK